MSAVGALSSPPFFWSIQIISHEVKFLVYMQGVNAVGFQYAVFVVTDSVRPLEARSVPPTVRAFPFGVYAMPTTVAELFFWLLGLTGFGLFTLLAWSLRNVLSNLIRSIDLLRSDIKELFNDNTALRKEIADLKINCARQHGTGRRKVV